MKNYLIILIFVLSSLNLSAQQGFFYQLPVDDSVVAMRLYDILIDQDTIVYYGVFLDKENYLGMFFSKMDTLGNVLAYNELRDSLELSSSLHGKIVKTVDNGYAIQGTVGIIKPDSSGYYQETYMIKVNHDLDLEFLKYYPFPQFSNLLNYSILSANNGFYLFGTQQLPDVNDHNWFVIRTDVQGNLLWKKSYFTPNTRDNGAEMLRLDSNTMVLFGRTRDDLPPGGGNNGRFSYPRMLAIDTMGNEKWKWNWDGEKATNLTADALLATPDGGFVYGCAEVVYMPAGNVLFKPVVVKIDSNLEEEWRKYVDTYEEHLFNEPQIKRITMSKDSNYIVSGGLHVYIYHGKFSPEGDRLWARFDSTFVDWTGNEEGKAEGTAILSSGSIISGGEFTKLTNAGWTIWSFIMKLSPDGCMDTLACWPTAAVESLQTIDYQLDVYPNPASDVVHFSLSRDLGLIRKGRIIITDILGRKVEEMRYVGGDLAWDVGGVAEGIYFYRLVVDGVVLDVGRLVVE